MNEPRAGSRGATLQEIMALLGDIEAAKAEAILTTGATLPEIELAIAWAADESDVLGEMERPLCGRTATVYEILRTEELEDERRS